MDDLQGEIFVKSKEGEGTILGCFIPFQHSLIKEAVGIHEAIPLLLGPLNQVLSERDIKSSFTSYWRWSNAISNLGKLEYLSISLL